MLDFTALRKEQMIYYATEDVSGHKTVPCIVTAVTDDYAKAATLDGITVIVDSKNAMDYHLTKKDADTSWQEKKPSCW